MKGGFFTSKQTESKSRPDGKILSCASCGLYKHAESPKMKPFGNFKKGILNIGEAPGKWEDRKGKQWQGKTGRLLKETYAKFGIDLSEDCLNINAVNCSPPDNRTPSNYEIDCCNRVIVSKVIKEYNPSLIIVFGGSALLSVLNNRWKKDLGGIMKWRGWNIPDQDLRAWICPVFHPSFVERSEGKEVETIWFQDIEKALKLIESPFPKAKKHTIKIIDDLSILKKKCTDLIAFDYETTGLKPQAIGHRIICASVAINEYTCYAFMMPKSRKERRPFLEILNNPTIGKMAHNIKFEDTWTKVRLKTDINNWRWDSMLASHIMDNRPGVTGLKFQTYVNFGIIDYSSEVAPYLQSSDNKNGNGKNTVEELVKTKEGREKLLHYCALDSLYEYQLAVNQMSIIDYNFLPF